MTPTLTATCRTEYLTCSCQPAGRAGATRREYPWTFGYVPDYVTDARVLTRYLNEEHER